MRLDEVLNKYFGNSIKGVFGQQGYIILSVELSSIQRAHLLDDLR